MELTNDVIDNARSKFDFFPTPSEHAEYIFNSFKHKRKYNVLDICCGLGCLSKPWYDDNHNVTLVELNEDFIPYLQEYFPRANLLHCDFLKSNINSDYDVILCNPPFNTKDIPRIYMYFLVKILSMMNCNTRVFFIAPCTIVTHSIHIDQPLDYYTRVTQPSDIDYHYIYQKYGFIDISTTDLRFNKRIVKDLIAMEIVDNDFFSQDNIIQPYFYFKFLRNICNFAKTSVRCILLLVER